MQADQSLTFDGYRIDLPNEQIWQGNQLIPLTSKAFAVLRYLVEHEGQLVTKAELFNALWPGTAVSDGALTFCIVEIRKAIGDNAKAPRFIETVARRGYRFLPTATAQPVRGSRFKVQRSQSLPPNTQHRAPVFVGRESDLAQLHSWLAKALNGERQLIFVTGEAGIGKTTLIETFLFGVRSREECGVQSPKLQTTPNSELPSTPVPWFSWGQCVEQYGVGEPYMPILEALGRLCREPGGEQLVTLLHQHAPTWLVQMPTLLPAAELEVLQRKTAGATRERMLREMGEAIDAITAERPLVLWLEDLHWSDASTLELLALLARRREPARLLVIGTYRPVDVIVQEHPLRAMKQELQLHGLCAELPLGLLSEAQVAEYLAVRFQVPSPASAEEGQGEGLSAVALRDVTRLIHRRTDGNPLFMVTVVDDLLSQNVLISVDGQWAVQGELAALEGRVPDNLQQLIERQLERLNAEDQRVLEVASVAGMEFSAAAAAAGIETEPERGEERCERLVRQGHFLRASGTTDWPDGTVAARYSFLHALYREVLYDRIPAGRRQRLHLRIGERHEAAYGKRARKIAAELAVHFEQGRDYGKAVKYLQQAGENAVRRSAHQEAAMFLRKGLMLLPSLPDTPDLIQHEVNLQLALGDALYVAQGYTAPEVERAYARARELCGRMAGSPQTLFALGGLFSFHLMRGELETAEELAGEVMRFAQKVQVPALLVMVHQMLGATSFWRGQFTAAHTHWEQGTTFYSAEQRYPRGILHPGVVHFIYRGITLWSLGYPDQAIARCQDGLTLAHEIAQPFSLAYAALWTAWLHLQRGEVQQAREQVERLMVLAVDWAFPFWEALGTVFRGCLDAVCEHIEEGIVLMRQGIATHQATGIMLLYPANLTTLAEAYGKGGKPEEGLQVLPEALTVMTTTGQRHWEAELYRIKGELLLAQESKSQKSKVKSQKSGNPNLNSQILDPDSEAETCFLKAINIARQQQAKSLELRATMSLARLWQQQGKRHEAHKLLSDIYNWFTEGFDTQDLQEAKALIEALS
jgi:DNA-binding winged helix-turn-helix (wHTH) protein/predicted ATPase